MKVNPVQNNVSFQSKIKFVPRKIFRDKDFLPYVDCHARTEELQRSLIRDRAFVTTEVRTCTAGGVVDENGVLGFHLYDCDENIERVGNELAKIIDFQNGKNSSALVIGSKELPSRLESVPLFDRVRGVISQFVNPSVFKTHTNPLAESNVSYEKDIDTWFVYTPLPKYSAYMPDEPFINSLESLISAFKEIKIAPQDTLFIGEKQISKEECPRIFYDA